MDVVFSRSGSTHPLGKLDDEIRFDAHSSVRDLARSMAGEVGMNESEYLRHIVYSHVFGGEEAYKSLLLDRLSAVFRKPLIKRGTERAE